MEDDGAAVFCWHGTLAAFAARSGFRFRFHSRPFALIVANGVYGKDAKVPVPAAGDCFEHVHQRVCEAGVPSCNVFAAQDCTSTAVWDAVDALGAATGNGCCRVFVYLCGYGRVQAFETDDGQGIDVEMEMANGGSLSAVHLLGKLWWALGSDGRVDANIDAFALPDVEGEPSPSCKLPKKLPLWLPGWCRCRRERVKKNNRNNFGMHVCLCAGFDGGISATATQFPEPVMRSPGPLLERLRTTMKTS